MVKVDVVINGGGMVGLVLALALAKADFKVALVERSQMQFPENFLKPTARVSAVNLSSLALLRSLNVWQDMSQASQGSLQRLVVWDDLGGGEVSFDAAEIGKPELGYMADNREIIKSAWDKLQQVSGVILLPNEKPVALEVLKNHAVMRLQSGKNIEASLCVGADGAHSWLRHTMSMPINVRPYQHQAIIAVVETEKPHQQTGWQSFLTSGPLALLPLNDPRQCAIVWSNTDNRAVELMQMGALEFECELNNAFGSRLGQLRCSNDRQSFPLIMQHAERYVASRIALIGDAAHTLHPLAGQGVNLGFSDVEALVATLSRAKKKQQDIGELLRLRRYERARKGENSEMILAMRGFHELFSSTVSSVVQLRSHGFNFVDRCAWLKQVFMKAALK